MNVIQGFLEFLDRQRAWLPVLLRLVVGATFIAHGYGKVFERGILGTAQGFARMGIPLGGVLGLLVPIVEFFGGICLVLGLGTRVWAFLQSWDMVFAIVFVHRNQGFVIQGELVERGGKQVPVAAGWEWQALILAACLTLMIGGPGSLSIDAWFRRRSLHEAPR